METVPHFWRKMELCFFYTFRDSNKMCTVYGDDLWEYMLYYHGPYKWHN